MTVANGKPWCNEHKMHPSDCFELHYPGAVSGRKAPTEAEIREAIIREHVERQNANIRREAERMSRSIVDARKKFEDNRKKKGA